MIFLFIIIGLYFLILAVFMETFIVITELAEPTGISIEEARAEIETHVGTVEARLSTCAVYFKILQTFLCFLLINSFCFIFSMK